MSKRIAALPATIRRQAYIDMWAALGIDATQVKEAWCGPNDMVIPVFAVNEDGKHYQAENLNDEHEVATHVVSIQVLP
jgi:hypothetical protein